MTQPISDIGQFGRKGDVFLNIECAKTAHTSFLIFAIARTIQVDGEVYGSQPPLSTDL